MSGGWYLEENGGEAVSASAAENGNIGISGVKSRRKRKWRRRVAKMRNVAACRRRMA